METGHSNRIKIQLSALLKAMAQIRVLLFFPSLHTHHPGRGHSNRFLILLQESTR